MSKLSSEEREILEALEKDELKRSKKAANTQKRHQEFAGGKKELEHHHRILLS